MRNFLFAFVVVSGALANVIHYHFHGMDSMQGLEGNPAFKHLSAVVPAD